VYDHQPRYVKLKPRNTGWPHVWIEMAMYFCIAAFSVPEFYRSLVLAHTTHVLANRYNGWETGSGLPSHYPDKFALQAASILVSAQTARDFSFKRQMCGLGLVSMNGVIQLRHMPARPGPTLQVLQSAVLYGLLRGVGNTVVSDTYVNNLAPHLLQVPYKLTGLSMMSTCVVSPIDVYCIRAEDDDVLGRLLVVPCDGKKRYCVVDSFMAVREETPLGTGYYVWKGARVEIGRQWLVGGIAVRTPELVFTPVRFLSYSDICLDMLTRGNSSALHTGANEDTGPALPGLTYPGSLRAYKCGKRSR